MSSTRLGAILFGLVSLSLLAVGCGGGAGGKVPVDHPIYEFQPPEEEEPEDEDTDTDTDDADDSDAGDDADADDSDDSDEG
jgi:hypothetical protein